MPFRERSAAVHIRPLFVAVAVALSAGSISGAPAVSDALQISILSTRPGMVSGGCALLQVQLPGGVNPSALTAEVNGRKVPVPFRFVGKDRRAADALLTGLSNGDSTVRISAGARSSNVLHLVNHPITGPVFSGPKETPFVCETAHFNLREGGTLGAPLDADCSIRTRVDYLYRSTTGGELKPLHDLKSRPADLAQTTTSTGAKVPFVVRVETGTVNRSIYQISMLHDPAHEPEPDFAASPNGWNHRLIYMFGGGCVNGWYRQGSTTGGVENSALLRQGYALASASLNVFGASCDDVLAAETMMMVKERFIKGYGQPDFTIGMGCSGGAEQMYPIVQNYPGLLDGAIPGCSFPEVTSSVAAAFSDNRLLNHYFHDAAIAYRDQQKLAISGLATIASMITIDELSSGRINATETCPVVLGPALRYDAATNPRGARCDIYDHSANVFGRDPATGFAYRPLDNVGIQYGLKALNSGAITPDQFLDLNEKIGGFDHDGNVSPQRTVADLQAVRAAYRAGRVVNGGGGLANTPVIDYRAYADDAPGGNPHLAFFSFVARARIMKANGNHDSHIMLLEGRRDYGLYSLASPVLRDALSQMDLWLTRLHDDHSSDPQSVKVRRARPAGLVDACWSHDPNPQKIVEEQVYGSGRCSQLYPPADFPRGAAGLPLTADILKCRLKPIDSSDYKAAFSPEQKKRLQAIFPQGVCDASAPGMEQVPPVGPWPVYAPQSSPSAPVWTTAS